MLTGLVMLTQANAILRLLDDDEPGTVALVKAKLEEIAPLPELRHLRATAEGRAARHLDELIAELAQRGADGAFTAFLRELPEEVDLERASWLFARTFPPHDDFPFQRRALDEWGERFQMALSGAITAEDRVNRLVKFLSTEIGLRGNEQDYYNVNNSLLPRVIDSRRGIPISLALVYMLVARRAGVWVDGVSLPGHFVVRHENIFFDPFHNGKRIGLEECAALLEQQNLVLTPQHLQPTTPRQMLVRMLTNVYYVGEQSDPPLASKVGGWIGLLRAPGSE
jgi:regulator of sirC expression with transglutaminase-like and TPR domain